MLGKYIKAHIDNIDDASDVLQEIFIKINKNLGSLSDQNKLITDWPSVVILLATLILSFGVKKTTVL